MHYSQASDDRVAAATYQPEPTAAAAARRFVRDVLRSWYGDGGLAAPGPAACATGAEPGAADAVVADAVLLTSELVTNAVLHAGTVVQVTCRLLMPAAPARGPGGAGSGAPGPRGAAAVEIAVLDRRPALLHPDLPQTAAGAADRVSGRGLLLPAALASAWGVTYARAGKAVWFRIALPCGWVSCQGE